MTSKNLSGQSQKDSLSDCLCLRPINQVPRGRMEVSVPLCRFSGQCQPPLRGPLWGTPSPHAGASAVGGFPASVLATRPLGAIASVAPAHRAVINHDEHPEILAKFQHVRIRLNATSAEIKFTTLWLFDADELRMRLCNFSLLKPLPVLTA